MANVAEIQNGQVINGINSSQLATHGTSSLTSSSTGASKTVYDEDMFLKLLVAEMQYQDPLEPTSNTEYVSELASFTQIEAIQNMQGTVDTLGSEAYVGKYVSITTDDGEVVTGVVDFTQVKDGKTYISVNDELYSINNITFTYSDEYYDASITSLTFSSMVEKLPDVKNVTLENAEDVAACRALYDSLNDYQISFIVPEDYEKLTTLEKRIAELQKALESAQEALKEQINSMNSAASEAEAEATPEVEAAESTASVAEETE